MTGRADHNCDRASAQGLISSVMLTALPRLAHNVPGQESCHELSAQAQP